MSTECTANPLAISELLLAGDVILNLSSQVLNTLPGVPYFAAVDGELSGTLQPARVLWQDSYAVAVRDVLGEHQYSRVVLVCDSDCSQAVAARAALTAAQISFLLVRVSEACDASAFMDEEDAEAVSERLRQLGYL